MKKVVFAVGLTGGHIYPALAMAQDLEGKIQPLFVARSKSPLADRLLKNGRYGVVELRVSGLPRGRDALLRLWIFCWEQWRAFWFSWRMLADWKPDAVVGMGSYVAFPVVLAARLMGIKTMIYEPNAVFGLVNRVLVPLVDRVAITLSAPADLSPGKIIRVKAPLRDEIRRALTLESASLREIFGFDRRLPCVLVVGGSQGAAAINKAAAAAVARLKSEGIHFSFIHISGTTHYEQMNRFYQDRALLGPGGMCLAYGERMGECYRAASLVIARAGALTCLELMAFKRRALLVPLRRSSGDHQVKNAQYLEQSGIAKIIFEGDQFGDDLETAMRQELADVPASGVLAREPIGLTLGQVLLEMCDFEIRS